MSHPVANRAAKNDGDCPVKHPSQERDEWVHPAIRHCLESRQPRCCRQDAAAVDAPEHYHVYVIELGGEDGAPTRPPSVYVGQSVHSPDARFAQHRQGYKAARGVKRAGLWLRWRLFARLNPIPTRAEAERAERLLAQHLNSKGFSVTGGH